MVAAALRAMKHDLEQTGSTRLVESTAGQMKEHTISEG